MTDPIQPSTARLFEQGNYTGVAQRGDTDDWRTYASLGLIGKPRAALEGLPRFAHIPEAVFYTAVAHWMHGNDGQAAERLQPLQSPHAQNLLRLIRRKSIRVLAQLPWARQGPQDLLSAARHDSKFAVTNVSFHPQDTPNAPYADVQRFYDPSAPPDFYISQMAEWHVLPPNLQHLPCPIFGQTSDYDLHIQALQPWLPLFDEWLVLDGTEWADVRRLVQAPVSTFPKGFCLPPDLLPLNEAPREIDAFLSGTLLHPFSPEKGDLLHQLLGIPGLTVKLVNGFIPPAIYFRVLCDTKLTIAYVRRPGSTPTRGLEALAMGCAVLVQHGSVMTLFADEAAGVLTYDLDARDLGPAVRTIVEHWPDFRERARRGAHVIRSEFAAPTVASQYLRLLTVLAARPRAAVRRLVAPESLRQKRSVLCKGPLPGNRAVLDRLRESSLDRWRRLAATDPTPRLILDIARELMLAYMERRAAAAPASPDDALLNEALDWYRRGVRDYPHALVLRFNYIRSLLHFGPAAAVETALALAEESLLQPPAFWTVEALDDVFPWDVMPLLFNYRAYFDRVTGQFMEGPAVHREFVPLILASLHHYVGHYRESRHHFTQAVELDPPFLTYRLSLARWLAAQPAPQDLERAMALLNTLAQNSLLAVEAADLLRTLADRHRRAADVLAAVLPGIDRLRSSLDYLESSPAIELPQAPVAPPQPADPARFNAWTHALVLSLFMNLVERHGWRTVALYGAGKHARLFFSIWRRAPRSIRIACVVDDASRQTELEGVPIIPPERLASHAVDAVIICSDTFETAMLAKARSWRGIHRPIWGLYSNQGFQLS